VNHSLATKYRKELHYQVKSGELTDFKCTFSEASISQTLQLQLPSVACNASVLWQNDSIKLW